MKACTIPNTFQVLARLIDVFVPEVVDPHIENLYITRALDIILYKLAGGPWKDVQTRLDTSRYHLSSSLDKLSMTLTPTSELVDADKGKLLAYFSSIKSIRGQDIEGFLLTLLTK